jgi:hypothetical protein
MRVRGVRWWATAVLGALLAVVAGCGRAAFAPAWSAVLTWNTDLTVAGDSPQTGPLAVAAGDRTLVLADSFGHRLLVWSAPNDRWTGPRRVALPISSPVVALAVSPAPTDPAIYAATADGAVWALAGTGGLKRIADFASRPGDLRRVVGMAMGRQGLWVDVVSVRVDASTRELVSVGSGATRVLQHAVLAVPAPTGAVAAPDWLLSPAGVRAALATGPGGVPWLVGRDKRGGPALLRLGADARPEGTRRWPQGATRTDFLGVAPTGLAYALVAAGRSGQRLEGISAAGTVRRSRALPVGEGPQLPHPVAMAPDGAVAVLASTPTGLDIHWYPPGKVWADGGGAPARNA